MSVFRRRMATGCRHCWHDGRQVSSEQLVVGEVALRQSTPFLCCKCGVTEERVWVGRTVPVEGHGSFVHRRVWHWERVES